VLELAVRFGKTLILSDCEGGIEPMLLPLLGGEWRAVGGRSVVNVGDKVVDVSPRFSLVLTARTAPAPFPPAHSALVTVVNSTATRSGLQGQLLAATLQAAAPQLEAQRSALVATQETLGAQQRLCEAALLGTLAGSRGNLLENRELLAQLSESKARACAIESSLASGERAGVELEAQRARYAPLATAGARLFFGLRALKALCPMYDFGLEAFLRIFKAVLRDPSLPGALSVGEAGSSGGGEEGACAAPGGSGEGPSGSGSSPFAMRLRGLISGLAWRALGMVLRGCLKADRVAVALHCLRSIAPEAFEGGRGGGGGAGGLLAQQAAGSGHTLWVT
jgi:hypothetical protein